MGGGGKRSKFNGQIYQPTQQIYFRKLMQAKDSEQSDNEGFVPNHIKIHSQSVAGQELQQTKSKGFEAHYILGEGLLRKEPIEAIQPYSSISTAPISTTTTTTHHSANNTTYHSTNTTSYHQGKGNTTSDCGLELPTASQLYNNTNHYSLVYSRTKQPFGHGDRSAFSHQVKLGCCDSDNDDSFRVLKEWDQKCLGQEGSGEGLLLDSLFEGGNLRCAFKEKKSANSYVLFMQDDTNTYGYNQWFYFSIRRAQPHTTYTFKIPNFKKPYSFFAQGLQPLVFSLQKHRNQGQGWYRDGTGIRYSPSSFRQQASSPYYTLEFSLQFEYSNDYITLSPSPPYSYTKLITTLHSLEAVAASNQVSWKLKSISHSIARNQVPYLLISSKPIQNKQKKENKQNKEKREKEKAKRKILLLARQHPGEVWSSFLVEEIIRQLAQQQTAQARWLLSNFDFHIFPMLNVDGVIYGNFRCDLAGNDLNRTWKSPSIHAQPQIHTIRKEIQRLSEHGPIQMTLDLHTHSRDHGVFAFCCVDTKECRELPSLLSKSLPFFRLAACTFGIAGEKQYTARASVFEMTNNANSLTVELSACGYRPPGRKHLVPYTPKHIKTIATSILKTYFAYKHNLEPTREVVDYDTHYLTGESEVASEGGWDVSQVDMPVEGSDSEPEADEIAQEVKMKSVYPQRFIQDIQYSKLKKLSKTHPKNYKKLNKEPSTANYQTKLPRKLKSTTTEVREDKPTKTPLAFQPLTSFVKDDQPQPPRSKHTSYNPKHPPNTKPPNPPADSPKKPQNERPAKPLNLIEFSLKKLPIFPQEKVFQPNTHVLLNEPPVINGFSHAKKQQRLDKTYSTYETVCRPRVRTQSRKLGFERDSSRVEQQLPFLCIMSETKKQVQLDRGREKKEQRWVQRRGEPKYLINGHCADEIKVLRFRDKQRQVQLFTKIGLDNYTRYAENAFLRKS